FEASSLTASVRRHGDEFDRRRQMRGCFGVGRALERALTGLAPILDSRLAQSSLGKVTRQNFRLIFGNFSELAFQGLCDASVKRASGLAQQRAIGGVLYKRMLEQVGCLRRNTLSEEQTSGGETIQRRSKLLFRFANHRSKERMGESPPDRCSNLCHLLGGAE